MITPDARENQQQQSNQEKLNTILRISLRGIFEDAEGVNPMFPLITKTVIVNAALGITDDMYTRSTVEDRGVDLSTVLGQDGSMLHSMTSEAILAELGIDEATAEEMKQAGSSFGL